MKLQISKEWAMKMAEREAGHSIGACSPEIAERAKQAALAHGHKSADEMIVCVDGTKRPVWEFYVGAAVLPNAS